MLVKVSDFRGTTMSNLKHQVVSIFKKKPTFIIIPAGTNDATLENLLELRQEIMKLFRIAKFFYTSQNFI